MTANARIKSAFAALLENRLDALRADLDGGVDVNAPAGSDVVSLDTMSIAPGDRLLHLALWRENRDAIELLLRFNPDIGIASHDGVTPLQIAIGRGMEDIAAWFLEAGASPFSTDACGLSPIHYTKTPCLLSALLDRGVPVDLLAQSTHWTPLHYAAYHNDSDKADVLLQHGASAKAEGRYGETPLHLLVAQRYRDVRMLAARLVAEGGEPNAQDDSGNTPLHWAVGARKDRNWMNVGNPDAVAYLLEHGADPRLRNRNGRSPMQMAFRNSDEAYRQPFLGRGIKPRVADTLKIIYPGAVGILGLIAIGGWVCIGFLAGMLVLLDDYWHFQWTESAIKLILLPMLFTVVTAAGVLFAGAVVESVVGHLRRKRRRCGTPDNH